MTHGVSESTGARTPVAVWEVTVPQWIDVAGVAWLGFEKDVLLVGDLTFWDYRCGDTAGEK